MSDDYLKETKEILYRYGAWSRQTGIQALCSPQSCTNYLSAEDDNTVPLTDEEAMLVDALLMPIKVKFRLLYELLELKYIRQLTDRDAAKIKNMSKATATNKIAIATAMFAGALEQRNLDY